jgi:uncharacterized protein YwqG
MAMDDAKFVELLREAGLREYTEAILRYKQPCIRLHARRVADSDSLLLGASRIGGLPDLPPTMEWPIRNGRPCEFIAQINLSHASPYDPTGLLPKEGLLLFFYDGLEYLDSPYQHYQKGSETIRYYTGDIAKLERATVFPDALEKFQRYRTCSIIFETDWMLPQWATPAAIALEREVFGRKEIIEPETPLAKIYRQVVDELEPYEDQDKHHLFGYPEPIIQDDPLYEIPEAWDGKKMDHNLLAEWIYLLQISSDDGPGMLWADTSSLYYCIRRDDLLAGKFENAICVEQNC